MTAIAQANSREDVRELDGILRELMPDLLAYLARRLDDPQDAADALSEVLLVLWRRRAALPADELGARKWAYGVARKVLANARRGHLRRLDLADRLRESLPRANRDLPMDIDLRRALQKLSEIERELILLVAWEGQSVADAGRMLGLGPGAARTRYSRARVRLRGLL